MTTNQFKVCDRVAVRDYLTIYKWQFGKITAVLGVLHYDIKLDDGRIWKRHVDQIRKIGEDLNRDTLIEVLPPEETEGANSVMKNSPEPWVMKDLPEPQQSLQKTKTDSTEVAKSQQEEQQTTEPIKTTTTVGDDVRRSNRMRRPPQRLQYGN
ncbi:PREDICTED: uncharacterized protein LOC108361316 [Rhagoletis zephyria]|uniref:uncharacterized protein LOC108361316 n=1 Tax=Rhagoletis zephyria TaxID=28612 RepID=UPI0008113790|nr:PREDICTED: uncharacterized protein LOC108361316 [Rhagoletis zephyria]XP_036346043.1 uncharacterized protein LOC118755300 [Rhagoletis pomonella]